MYSVYVSFVYFVSCKSRFNVNLVLYFVDFTRVYISIALSPNPIITIAYTILPTRYGRARISLQRTRRV